MPTYSQRLCALSTCRAEFTPTRAYQLYCCYKHAKASWNRIPKAEQRQRRLTKAQRHPKARFVYEMLSEAEPGMCPWGCERPLPPGRKVTCGKEGCEKAYQDAYRVGRRGLERQAWYSERACACGCGSPLEPKTRKHMYISRQHNDRAKRARSKAAQP